MPELGDRFIISAKLIKTRDRDDQDRTITTWKREPFEVPKSAMFIGIRRIYDGVLCWHQMRDEWDDKYPYFQPTQVHMVYLMVLNANQNPIYVHPEDAISIEVREA